MAVDPMMMGAGPMIPPPPVAAAPVAPMADVPPAVGALPGIAQLAQEQTMQMLEEQRRMEDMREKMQRDMMMLIAAMPTPNPAGEAAVSTPMTPMMGGSGAPMMGGAPMGDMEGGY